jgi:hypothetical protein
VIVPSTAHTIKFFVQQHGDSRHIIIFNNSRSTFKTTINQAADGQMGHSCKVD